MPHEMTPVEPHKITKLLKDWAGGQTEAEPQLIQLVYDELRRLARHHRRHLGGGDTLQTTALVHEAYLRLVKIDDFGWRDRAHFFALAAQLMRRILIDAARASAAAKRGGPDAGIVHPDLDALPAPQSDRGSELIALDEKLIELARLDPRRARVIELRVFGGLSHEETAEILGISPQSVMRDWRLAKAWLLRELSRGNG
jgi:RNA polymerase sigma factor (TIGR02999 family)